MKTIQSVLNQKNKIFDLIVIDGNSNDQSLNILNQYKNHLNFISEKDLGIYDAMNKGIKYSDNQYIWFLNSGDQIINDEIGNLLHDKLKFNYDLILSGTIIKNNFLSRNYKSNIFKKERIKIGIMPPHPSTIFKKSLFDKIGLFSLSYSIASDFDWIVRLFNYCKPSILYLDDYITIMEKPGVSRNYKLLNLETLSILKKNKINSSFIKIIFFKYFYKLINYFL